MGVTPGGTAIKKEGGGAPVDEKKNGGRHYRRFYADELEHVKDIMPVETPFDVYPIKKG
jgi:hypothetical protein